MRVATKKNGNRDEGTGNRKDAGVRIQEKKVQR